MLLIEKILLKLCFASYRRPYLALILLLLLLAFAMLMLPRLYIDSSNEGYFDEQSSERQNLALLRDNFGSSDYVYLELRNVTPFSVTGLAALEELVSLIKQGSHIQRIDSLLNSKKVYSSNDNVLHFQPYLQNWRKLNKQQLKKIAADMRSDELVINRFLSSSDANVSAIIVTRKLFQDSQNILPFDESNDPFPMAEGNSPELSDPFANKNITAKVTKVDHQAEQQFQQRFYHDVLANIAQFQQDHPQIKVEASGEPLLFPYLAGKMETEITRGLLRTLIFCAIVMLLFLQSVALMLSALLIALLTVLFAFSLLLLFGWSYMLPTQGLPVFLATVALGDAIHFLLQLNDLHQQGMNRQQALINTAKNIIHPCLLTSITTAIGFGGFMLAPIAPVKQLGFLTLIGVFAALLLTLLLIPALWRILPQCLLAPVKGKQKRVSWYRPSFWVDRGCNILIRSCLNLANRHRALVFTAFILLLLGLVPGLARVDFGHNPLKWLGKNDPMRLSTEQLEQDFNGIASMDVLLSNGDGVLVPALLAEQTNAFKQAQQRPELSFQSIELASFIKPLHHAWSDDLESDLPQSQELLQQELLLLESDDPSLVGSYINFERDLTRSNLTLKWEDSRILNQQAQKIKDELEATLAPENQVIISGSIALLTGVLVATIRATIRSVPFTLLLIILAILMAGWKTGRGLASANIGLMALLPNFLPLLFTLGLMGWLAINIDLFNMMILGIVFGLAVDDTIHILHLASDNNPQRQLQGIITAGKAICCTSLSLAAGFGSLALAELRNFVPFGLLSAAAILLAMFADLILLPALIGFGRPPKVNA